MYIKHTYLYIVVIVNNDPHPTSIFKYSYLIITILFIIIVLWHLFDIYKHELITHD